MHEALSFLPNLTDETARKVWIALSDEEKRVLEASYGRTERRAAEVFGLSKTAYRYMLKKAIARAEELAALVEQWRG
jgi:hypothetical protein